jgi:hypothetical protein
MQNFPEMKFDILLKETMKQSNPTIVFVCEHGAAKSVIAAAYFNKLAQEKTWMHTPLPVELIPTSRYLPRQSQA